MWNQVEGEVLENRQVGPDVMKMLVLAKEAAAKAAPGQFFHIRCSEGSDPFLRRPISIYSLDRQSGVIGLLFRVVGQGTRYMSSLGKGSALDMLGPLGNGWPDAGRGHAIVVAGGIGVAPMPALAGKCVESGITVSFLLGARTGQELWAQEDIRHTGAELAVSTDDGSAGHHGFVTGLLLERLAALQGTSGVTVFACGPGPMLRAVQRICKDAEKACYVSLEQRMGCGVGACLGCAVKTTLDSPRYAKVCTDGPVFDARTVVIEDV